jgi:hypothetical protein
MTIFLGRPPAATKRGGFPRVFAGAAWIAKGPGERGDRQAREGEMWATWPRRRGSGSFRTVLARFWPIGRRWRGPGEVAADLAESAADLGELPRFSPRCGGSGEVLPDPARRPGISRSRRGLGHVPPVLATSRRSWPRPGGLGHVPAVLATSRRLSPGCRESGHVFDGSREIAAVPAEIRRSSPSPGRLRGVAAALAELRRSGAKPAGSGEGAADLAKLSQISRDRRD